MLAQATEDGTARTTTTITGIAIHVRLWTHQHLMASAVNRRVITIIRRTMAERALATQSRLSRRV